MTDPRTENDAVAQVLAQHQYAGEVLAVLGDAWTVCVCGQTLPLTPEDGLIGADQVRLVLARHQAEALATSALVKPPKSDSEKRWDTAIDWVLNHGVTYDLVPAVFAYTDGLITEKEMRDQSVTVATINRREERRAAREKQSNPPGQTGA